MVPKLYRVNQRFRVDSLSNIPASIAAEFTRANRLKLFKPGAKIAVSVGSRGIANINIIVAAAIKELKKLGMHPFIVPAMGSHGGATAAGQVKVLKSLGITEAAMGVPIHSGMDVVRVGTTPTGVPVYLDKIASEADGIFVINRVKPHTDFDAPIESGLVKMIAIGLGNHQGCVSLHTHGLCATIPEAARVVLEKGYVVGGLAIIENSREQTALLEVISPDGFMEREKELLTKAKLLMARLPFPELDVLVVKTMGKTISGTGMDTNVIGRLKVEGLPEPEGIRIKRIVALDLLANSYGNALGIGLADLTTKKLVEKIDFAAMHANVISTNYLERGKIPIYLETDRLAIETALKTIGPVAPEKAKLCVIKNTLELEEMYISAGLLAETRNIPDIVINEEIAKIPYSATGDLMLFEKE